MLGLLALYLPFCWLIFTGWQGLRLWPVFPGLVITYLLRAWVPQSWIPQWTFLPLTALFVTLILLGLRRVRRGFWALLAGIFALSCAFAFLAYLMMRA